MKILILFGSPKTNGSTAKLTGAFMKGIRKSDDVEIVHLFSLQPTPCNACGYCKAANGCSKKDLEKFMAKLEDADAVIVATPVYNLSFPAPMKALFDRFQRYYEARFRRKIAQPITKHKKALLLVTAGDDEDDGYNIIEKQVKLSFSVMNTELVGGVLAKDTDNGGVKEDDLRRAFELSKIIYG